MRRLRYLPLPAFLLSVLLPLVGQGAPWVESKQFFAENAGLASSMVDAADLDNDGYVDLVFANGVGYDKGTPDSDLRQQAFHNDAGATMTDISETVFGIGPPTYNGRAIKLRDVDGDDDIDVVLGTTWQSQSQLFLNDGLGSFSNETATHLPQIKASIGDLELGDVDGDGDLDIVLADWGQFSPVSANLAGGVTQLWTQMDGTGMFEDATLAQMPNLPIRWAWDLELVDINNDWNLDLVLSCFACDKNSVYLFANDGQGNFSDVTLNVKGQGQEGLDVEVVDLNNDSFLDLISLHDGVGGRNRVLINNKAGGFEDFSDQVWPKLENPSSYDHMAAVLDYNSDGLPDLAIGALQPGDNKYANRLMMNVAGKFSQNVAAFEESKPSPGTYAIVLADFNLDRILDMAMSQNENAVEKKVFLGNAAELNPDTAAPQLPNYETLGAVDFGAEHSLRVRSHDNKTPVMPHDFQRAVDEFHDGRPYVEHWSTDPGEDLEMNPGQRSAPGTWYGEALWKITFIVPNEGDRFAYRICAIDAAHNKACTGLETIEKPEPETTTDPGTSTGDDSTSTTDDSASTTGGLTDSGTDPTVVPTTDGPPDTTMSPTTLTTGESDSETNFITAGEWDDDGCGCATSRSPVQGLLGSLALFGLLGLRARRRR